jgi:hypothetical protein
MIRAHLRSRLVAKESRDNKIWEEGGEELKVEHSFHRLFSPPLFTQRKKAVSC